MGAERFCSKAIEVKLNGRLHISKRFLIRVAFSDYDAPDAAWVGHVTVTMFFHNDLEMPHYQAPNTTFTGGRVPIRKMTSRY